MSRQDSVDKFYEYDIYLPTNTLYVGSVDSEEDGTGIGVNFQMSERAVKGLHILDSRGKAINVLMNNPGGDVIHGMAIYDAIKECKNDVNIKVYGQAMSMGSVILQAADERILTPNCRVMLHYGSFGMSDHAKIVEKWVQEIKEFDKWMEDLFLSKIKVKKKRFTRQQLQNKMKFDWILTAQEAIEYGLADRIEV